jgi:methanogenic corrinoid protein MtbC1
MLSLGRFALRDAVIQKQLSDAIMKGDAETAETKAKILAQYADDPTEALDDLYDAFRTVQSLRALGDYDERRFEASANAARAALNVLKSSLIPKQTRFTARVCVGPISGGGDIMSSIMAAMLSAAGHEGVDLSKSTTPRELLRNAEQNGAQLLVVSLGPETASVVEEFAREFESGGVQQKFQAIAFVREPEIAGIELGPFALVAHDPLELLSKTTELLIRSQMSLRKQTTT